MAFFYRVSRRVYLVLPSFFFIAAVVVVVVVGHFFPIFWFLFSMAFFYKVS